ncbi:MAG: pyridoxamine 5'-phosphate oxidase family protein [Parasphingorhabdus sp.]|uniref:pyridoxamine 5'-phosphate oxidase family protein n=1 Tax=Parasphingorhabdus sp. TaxID=2709688 RepID=UPI003001E12D
MTQENLEELYDMIDDVGTAMLVTENNAELRSRPMTGKLHRDTGEIWFLTETASEKIREISKDGTANLTYACPEKETYISISGSAKTIRNQDKIDDLWGPWAEAWLQCEKDDQKVSAICFKPEIAEYWSSPSSTIVQSWELAKAKITDEKPDLGENKTVKIA